MPSSTQRASANMGRRQSLAGSSQPHHSAAMLVATNDSFSWAGEYDETDHDTALITRLNKANSQCDQYKALWEQATRKLAETQQQKEAARAQIVNMEDEIDMLRRENARLLAAIKEHKRANIEFSHRNQQLSEMCTNLHHQSQALATLESSGGAYTPASSSSTLATAGATNTFPDRTRSTHRASRQEGHRGERGGPRSNNKRESREYSAEKERLKGRFEEKPPAPAPPTSRRSSFLEQSFLEPFGPREAPDQQGAPPNRINQGQAPRSSGKGADASGYYVFPPGR
jgi:hypothetical protein